MSTLQSRHTRSSSSSYARTRSPTPSPVQSPDRDEKEDDRYFNDDDAKTTGESGWVKPSRYGLRERKSGTSSTHSVKRKVESPRPEFESAGTKTSRQDSPRNDAEKDKDASKEEKKKAKKTSNDDKEELETDPVKLAKENWYIRNILSLAYAILGGLSLANLALIWRYDVANAWLPWGVFASIVFFSVPAIVFLLTSGTLSINMPKGTDVEKTLVEDGKWQRFPCCNEVFLFALMGAYVCIFVAIVVTLVQNDDELAARASQLAVASWAWMLTMLVYSALPAYRRKADDPMLVESGGRLGATVSRMGQACLMFVMLPIGFVVDVILMLMEVYSLGASRRSDKFEAEVFTCAITWLSVLRSTVMRSGGNPSSVLSPDEMFLMSTIVGGVLLAWQLFYPELAHKQDRPSRRVFGLHQWHKLVLLACLLSGYVGLGYNSSNPDVLTSSKWVLLSNMFLMLVVCVCPSGPLPWSPKANPDWDNDLRKNRSPKPKRDDSASENQADKKREQEKEEPIKSQPSSTTAAKGDEYYRSRAADMFNVQRLNNELKTIGETNKQIMETWDELLANAMALDDLMHEPEAEQMPRQWFKATPCHPPYINDDAKCCLVVLTLFVLAIIDIIAYDAVAQYLQPLSEKMRFVLAVGVLAEVMGIACVAAIINTGNKSLQDEVESVVNDIKRQRRRIANWLERDFFKREIEIAVAEADKNKMMSIWSDIDDYAQEVVRAIEEIGPSRLRIARLQSQHRDLQLDHR